MDTGLIKEWARLDIEYNELKRQMNAAKAERDKIESQAMEMLHEEGIGRMTVDLGKDGSRTIYTRRQLWAGHNGNKEMLCEALKQAGLGDYVKPNFNAQQLSAYVREFDPDNMLEENDIKAKLPVEVQPYIKVTEKLNLQSRKA